jgi:hypothetical protein
MPKPRSAQIAIEKTPYYHLISRCLCSALYTIAQRLTTLNTGVVGFVLMMSSMRNTTIKVRVSASSRRRLWLLCYMFYAHETPGGNLKLLYSRCKTRRCDGFAALLDDCSICGRIAKADPVAASQTTAS